VITITLNGETRSLANVTTVTTLVADVTGRRITDAGRAEDGSSIGVAVARNGEVVPRSRWSAATLDSGDIIELLTAVQGG
jgi:sulfur carrier protein